MDSLSCSQAPFFAYVDGDQFAFRIDPLSKRGATTQIEVARDVFHLAGAFALERSVADCEYLVDDENLTLEDDVVAVALEELFGADRIVQKTHEWCVDRVVKIVDPELVLDLVDSRLKDTDGLLLFVNLVVLVADEEACTSPLALQMRVPQIRKHTTCVPVRATVT